MLEDSEELLQEMLDWAFGGFQPSGPSGLKPINGMSFHFIYFLDKRKVVIHSFQHFHMHINGTLGEGLKDLNTRFKIK